MHRPTTPWLPVCVLLAACGTPATHPDAAPIDAGRPIDAQSPADARPTEDGAIDDAGSPIDAEPRADAGCPASFAACPHPPSGSTRCGGGAIDPGAARAACDALDPARDLFTGISKACSAFTIDSGRFEVYCGTTGIYVWIAFDAIHSADVLECSYAVPVPDGGVLTGTAHQLWWGLDDANSPLYGRADPAGSGMLSDRAWAFTSSAQTDDPSRWEGSLAVDGVLGAGTVPPSGSGTIYVTAPLRDCDNVPAAPQVVLAVPISWAR